MNTMDEQLWEYIDGTLSRQKTEEIERLIATDMRWKEAYEQQLAFSKSLRNFELDEPSMGFNFRVMEAIRTETALEPLKTRINPYIIWGIGLVFLTSVIAILSAAFKTINWAQASAETSNALPMSQMQHILSNKTALQIGMFISIVLVLFLADKLLNRRLHEKISAS